ncbi:hypothetical protein [Rossellomorea vietnamensis]|uniref:hypothetical protein n=1 Tax=Rossellomorea vietnamensis TaxID=218284 RepID=UPI001E3FD14E|nr:hypothetical protein [Rossellomorea vietnamensis]MCC5804380.1 hypothetical protein [Rossellomorea vietnamensis]
MTKKEFEKFIAIQNIDTNKLNLVTGEKKIIPYVTGCFEEDGVWKIYMVGELQDFDIVQEGTEEEIFNVMSSITKSELNTVIINFLTYKKGRVTCLTLVILFLCERLVKWRRI